MTNILRYNIKRHKTLELLSAKRILGESGQLNEPLGVKYEDIYSYLNCNEKEGVLIFSRLFLEKEIAYHNAYGVKGLCLTKEGLTAFSNKKYIHENYSIVTNFLKNIVQIFIPLASLVIAYLALTLRQNEINDKHEKEKIILEKRLRDIEIQLTKSK